MFYRLRINSTKIEYVFYKKNIFMFFYFKAQKIKSTNWGIFSTNGTIVSMREKLLSFFMKK